MKDGCSGGCFLIAVFFISLLIGACAGVSAEKHGFSDQSQSTFFFATTFVVFFLILSLFSLWAKQGKKLKRSIYENDKWNTSNEEVEEDTSVIIDDISDDESCHTGKEMAISNDLEISDESEVDSTKADDHIRQMFMRSYDKSIHLWEKRQRIINQFHKRYSYEYRDDHEEEYDKAEEAYDKELENNALQIDKLRFDLEGKIPQDILLLYKKHLSNLEYEIGHLYMISRRKNVQSNVIEMELSNIPVHINYARLGFNNVWINNLLEISVKSNYFSFYPEYVISTKEMVYSKEFNICPMEDVSVEFIEQTFTEKIERLSDGYIIKRFIYSDKQGKAPKVIDEGIECPEKVYGKLSIKPMGIFLLFDNPAEGRKIADGIMEYTSNYRRIKKLNLGEMKTPLDNLIGLKRVKEEVTTLTNYIKMKQKRDEMNLTSPNVSYHCVFSGNPGTGKTTVARIITNIYWEMGILKQGHLVETDRSGLVAEYVGQTAVKTNKIIDSALDGVLFIDEAYTLAQGGKEDYGAEAIATLLKRMEDDRDRLVVILAGYTEEIEQFINSNPGLRSRFNRYIHFEDYTADELFEIFCLQVKKNEYTLSDDAALYLKEQLNAVVANKPKDFGNARYVRNLFEKTIERQANRLASVSNLTKENIAEICKEDIPN